MSRLADLPFIVLLMGIGALAMLVPAIHATVTSDYPTARAFFYPALMCFVLFATIALATQTMRIRRQGRSLLISILACLTVLPAMLAVPIAEAVPDTRFYNAYFEMVSSITTTGMSYFPPERLPPSVHLWRAEVAWLGGFFAWLVAIAVMAPLNLGGFELSSRAEVGQGAQASEHPADPGNRLRRYGAKLFPVYGGLTLVLWFSLYVAGDAPLTALCHAMSTLSTSGISPVGGVGEARSGIAGELLIFLFFGFALSRVTFLSEERPNGFRSVRDDPEVRLGLGIAGALTLFLFVRHWLAVLEEDVSASLLDGLAGLWGTLFTVTSFLTTTGFESAAWSEARAWSGFDTPGTLLMGLAVFGGGVATTAGGVKLLRCYSLARHGLREMEKLVQPHSIGMAGRQGRYFRRQGAFIAWVFFMLFAVALAATVSALALFGSLNFEETMVLTIAALSTTGPLVEVAGSAPIDLAALNDATRAILMAAMVVGRLETLAIIALLNPEFWR
jgi:trk system potassium uptake protein TrkH